MCKHINGNQQTRQASASSVRAAAFGPDGSGPKAPALREVGKRLRNAVTALDNIIIIPRKDWKKTLIYFDMLSPCSSKDLLGAFGALGRSR
jgi:hypothetical protein